MTLTITDKMKVTVTDKTNLPHFTILVQFDSNDVRTKFEESLQSPYITEMISTGTLVGELDPLLDGAGIDRFLTVKLAHIGHIIKSFRILEGGIEFKCELMEDDRLHSKMLAKFIEDGRVKFQPRVIIANDIYHLVTIDMVLDRL